MMRTGPALTQVGTLNIYDGATGGGFSGFSAGYSNFAMAECDGHSSVGGMVPGRVASLYNTGSPGENDYIAADGRL